MMMMMMMMMRPGALHWLRGCFRGWFRPGAWNALERDIPFWVYIYIYTRMIPPKPPLGGL